MGIMGKSKSRSIRMRSRVGLSSIRVLICAFLFGFALVGCAGPAPSPSGEQGSVDGVSGSAAPSAGVTVAQIQERGYLLVGASGDYCPMSMRNEDGSYWGFDADLAQDLADDLGVELRYVETTWPTILDDCVEGRFDIALCGISITDARLERAIMSDPYLTNGKTALMRAEDVDVYTSLDAINREGVRVIENPGGTNERLAREWLPNAEITIHDVNEEIPALIAEGEGDVMITETSEAGYYVSRDPRLAAPLIDEPFSHGVTGALMNADSEDLLAYVNDFLAREEASGRLDELRVTYIYGDAEELPEAA